MEEEYVSYSQAVALKECGFDWKCSHYYFHSADGSIYLKANLCGNYQNVNNLGKSYSSAPTLALAQKWLREVKGIHVLPTLESVNQPYYVCYITQLHSVKKRITDNARYFSTYESAIAAGLDAALELIKQK